MSFPGGVCGTIENFAVQLRSRFASAIRRSIPLTMVLLQLLFSFHFISFSFRFLVLQSRAHELSMMKAI
ncbi:hypothetical protein K449DRAFT_312 [Hypoxylon sp. EC38]|nr:hypothetical protein K449DRAFT_312 [Hypoxylon sp. EC38]